jgi:hypothetical protein
VSHNRRRPDRVALHLILTVAKRPQRLNLAARASPRLLHYPQERLQLIHRMPLRNLLFLYGVAQEARKSIFLFVAEHNKKIQ